MSDRRVLLVTNTLGKWGEINGVEYTYVNLLKQFRKAGMRVDLVTYGPDDAIEKHGSVTVHTHRPRLPLRIEPSLSIDLALRWTGLARRILEKKYSLVHSATPDPLGILAARAAWLSNCPLVNVYHTVLDHYARVRVGRRLGKSAGEAAFRAAQRMLKWYYDKSDLVLAPSAATRDEIAGVFDAPVEVFPRGIDSSRFNPRHRRRGRGEGRPQALYVGRVAPEKNLELLVRIFRERPDIELKIVGGGPSLNHLKREFPQAVYTGMLTGEALLRAFADADFFVFPSRSDTFGNVVLQALCSGTPAVVTDSMGPREQVIHGLTGFIATDDRSFAEHIDTLAADPSLCERMGRAARAEAMLYSWESLFEMLLKFYRRATELHTNCGREGGAEFPLEFVPVAADSLRIYL